MSFELSIILETAGAVLKIGASLKLKHHQEILLARILETHCIKFHNFFFRKMVREGVNFINILCAHFSYKSASLSFSPITFWRKTALLYKKLVRKMLKKFTAGIPHSLRPYVWMRLTGALQKKAASELTYKQIVKASTNDHLVNYNIEYITLIQSNIFEPYFHIIQQYLHFCVNTF